MKRLWIAACLAALLPVSAAADAIMVSRAMLASTILEAFVEEDRVRIELEIGVSDVQAFRELLPDGLYEQLGFPPEPWAERLARFPTESLVVWADGTPLAGVVTHAAPRERIRRDEITGEALARDPDEEAETVIAATVEYPFRVQPRSLSISPPPGNGGPPATIGFVLYHRGLAVNDFRYLGSAEVVDLDWSDPWYSRFRNRNLRRQYDAPLSVFLYVEPYEVRYEVISRPLDLERWVDLGLEGADTIGVDVQERIRQRAGEFLAEHLRATIDGEEVTPTLERIHFLRRTLRRSTVVDPPEPLDAVAATLGAIFVVPTQGLPQTATLAWDLFPQAGYVYAAATDEAGPFPVRLDPTDPVLRWENFLKDPTLPTLSTLPAPPSREARALAAVSWVAWAALAGVGLWQAWAALRRRTSRAGLALAALLLCAALATTALARRERIDDARAEEILGALVHNVYRAFDFRDEGAIYDVLEQSVAGDLLAELYLETRRGLELASQGGARVKVKDVEFVSVAPEPLDSGAGFGARAVWNVSGSVGHWGHVHQRANRYEARFEVRPIDGTWKITGMELLLEERVGAT